MDERTKDLTIIIGTVLVIGVILGIALVFGVVALL
jgi:hypothetical protein